MTWDVDKFLDQIPNRLFMEWMQYYALKADLEEEAIAKVKRKAERAGRR